MPDLELLVDDRRLMATWLDRHPGTRAAVSEALPLTVEAARWGDELYGSIGIDAPAEPDAIAVPEGTIAYWPQGDAICLFWGATPASTDGTPRAASAVAPLARVADVSPLSGLSGGAELQLRSL